MPFVPKLSRIVDMNGLAVDWFEWPCQRCCWSSWGSARRLFRHFTTFPSFFFLRRRQVLPWEEWPKLLPCRVTALFLSFLVFFLFLFSFFSYFSFSFYGSLCLDSVPNIIQNNSISSGKQSIGKYDGYILVYSSRWPHHLVEPFRLFCCPVDQLANETRLFQPNLTPCFFLFFFFSFFLCFI